MSLWKFVEDEKSLIRSVMRTHLFAPIPLIFQKTPKREIEKAKRELIDLKERGLSDEE